jgi:formate hydrogenlyase subunit 4
LDFNWPFIILHGLILILLPPLLPGLIAKIKAVAAGRRGPSCFQLYFDLVKLFRKGAVYSRTTSAIFRLAPLISVSALITAGWLLPVLGPVPIAFAGDMILFAYLLALARFFTLLAALDTGSSFEGMGASREATFGAFSELTFFMGFAVLAVARHTLSLGAMLQLEGVRAPLQPGLYFLFVAFFFLLLSENSRIPVDDPNTHLELTMIHEVLILDYSGPDLALVLYGASLKLFLYCIVAASLLWPAGINWGAWGLLALAAKVLGMVIAIGCVESALARLKLMLVPQVLIANFAVTVVVFLVTFIGKGF